MSEHASQSRHIKEMFSDMSEGDACKFFCKNFSFLAWEIFLLRWGCHLGCYGGWLCVFRDSPAAARLVVSELVSRGLRRMKTRSCVPNGRGHPSRCQLLIVALRVDSKKSTRQKNERKECSCQTFPKDIDTGTNAEKQDWKWTEIRDLGLKSTNSNNGLTADMCRDLWLMQEKLVFL